MAGVCPAEPAPAEFPEGRYKALFGGTANGGFYRKGDYVEVEKGGKVYRGWVCGLPTEKTPLVGVMDARRKRIGQFSPAKVRLLKQIVKHSRILSGCHGSLSVECIHVSSLG